MNINKSNPLLLHPLNKWMKKKKWSWFPHQIETFRHVQSGSDVVVFAPTGAGKTFGFGALMGNCNNNLLCYSPANRTSIQDFIGATTNAGVAVCAKF